MAGYAIDLYPKARGGNRPVGHLARLRLAAPGLYDGRAGLACYSSASAVGPRHPDGDHRARGDRASCTPSTTSRACRAALHTPDDGHVDPAGAAFALAKGARRWVPRWCARTGSPTIAQLPSARMEVSPTQGDGRSARSWSTPAAPMPGRSASGSASTCPSPT